VPPSNLSNNESKGVSGMILVKSGSSNWLLVEAPSWAKIRALGAKTRAIRANIRAILFI
jgi:hypothetical protein